MVEIDELHLLKRSLHSLLGESYCVTYFTGKFPI